MKIIIVTGMSGAGKSTALNVLEDEGYYCVDNMPISLMPKFAELADGHNQDKGYNNIALGIDIRSGHSLAELDSVLDYMKEKKYEYTIVFLESSDEVLIKRYKETRRAHPLAKDGRVDKAIMLEREQLKFLKQRADVIIENAEEEVKAEVAAVREIDIASKSDKELSVLVLCASGATSSMLANSISKGAKAKNIKLESIAMAYGQHKEVITDYDLIILAPQMASMYKELEKDCSAKGVKSATTSGVEYVKLTRDSLGALKFALDIINN